MPGFLRVGAEPLREAFLMVHDAADWCSLETTCRGFTISAEVHNDRLLWVRFSADSSVVVSSEWMSYLKEPAAAHGVYLLAGLLRECRRGTAAACSLGDDARRARLLRRRAALFGLQPCQEHAGDDAATAACVGELRGAGDAARSVRG